MSFSKIWQLVKDTTLRWLDDNPFRMGAALAYYTVFSLAPIVVIAVAVAGLFFEQGAVQEHFAREVGNMAGGQVGKAILEVAQYTEDTESSTLATIIGLITLLIGATSVFGQLQDALDYVWRVKADPNRSWWGMVRDRFFSFTIVIGLGFLLMVSLVVSTALTTLEQLWDPSSIPGGFWLWRIVNYGVSLGLFTLLFAGIFKILPDAKIAWRDVWLGAAVTAVLFNLGKYLISLYLGQSGMVSAYGAAGSLIVILVWVYYSSQILLWGAEFTFVHARSMGEPIEPARGAIPVHDESDRIEPGKAPLGRVSTGASDARLTEPAGIS